MGVQQAEDGRIFFRIELASEKVRTRRQSQRVGRDEGARPQFDVAVGNPVDRAQVVVHDLAKPVECGDEARRCKM